MKESYINDQALARRQERIDAKNKIHYSKEELIVMRLAKEEIGARSIPFFVMLLALIISGAVFSFGLFFPSILPEAGGIAITGLVLVSLLLGVLGIIAFGAFTVFFGLTYLTFLTTEKYRVSLIPASLYNEAIKGVSAKDLQDICYEAKRQMKTPLGARAMNNLHIPNIPNTTGNGVSPAFNANTMFDANSTKTMFN